MSQGELAEFANVTRTTVNKWESGRVSAPIPKVVAIHELARLFKGGLRDKERLKEELDKLTALDIDGLLSDLTRGTSPKADAGKQETG
jgi:transcriptional regulator with XRE-family HTH domain